MSFRFEKLPSELSSEIFSYLDTNTARHSVIAGVSDVFTSEWNRRWHRSSSIFYEAFEPTLGAAFTDLLFRSLIKFFLKDDTLERDLRNDNFIIDYAEYYRSGNKVTLRGSLQYTNGVVLELDNVYGYLDDNYDFHITNRISFIVHPYETQLLLELVEPDKIRVTYSDTTIISEYMIIRWGRLLVIQDNADRILLSYQLAPGNYYQQINTNVTTDHYLRYEPGATRLFVNEPWRRP